LRDDAELVHPIRPTPAGQWRYRPDEREVFWEKKYGEPGFGIWMGNFRDILTSEGSQRRDQRLHREKRSASA